MRETRMKKTHGMSSPPRHPAYRRWANIIQRCTNPNNPAWHNYGGRGITVCRRWLDFESFYEDVGDPPTPNHTLDRKNNDRGYMPSNVRWATDETQAANSRRAVQITHGGRTLCISEWCREVGIAYVTFKQRRRKGWSIELAATTPPDTARKRKPDGPKKYVPRERKAHIDSALGILGVHKRGARFEASIQRSGKWHYLGCFSTPEEAHATYLEAKQKLHAGNTP